MVLTPDGHIRRSLTAVSVTSNRLLITSHYLSTQGHSLRGPPVSIFHPFHSLYICHVNDNVPFISGPGRRFSCSQADPPSSGQKSLTLFWSGQNTDETSGPRASPLLIMERILCWAAVPARSELLIYPSQRASDLICQTIERTLTDDSGPVPVRKWRYSKIFFARGA